LIAGGFLVNEIVLSKEGVIFRRKRRPIAIKKITGIKETSRGRVLTLTGLTSEGRTIKRRVSWADVGKKRWEEFKNDLQTIQPSG